MRNRSKSYHGFEGCLLRVRFAWRDGLKSSVQTMPIQATVRSLTNGRWA